MSAGFEHVRVEHQGDVAVIILARVELYDRLVTDEVRKELARFIEAEQPRKVVVNLQNVAFCSTEVINGFLRARKRLGMYGGQFRLCCVCEDLRRVFRVLKLDGNVLDIHATLEEAVASFA